MQSLTIKTKAYMKNLLVTICLLCSGIVYAQNSIMNKLLNTYENEEDITVINISKSLFKMLPDNIKTDYVNINGIIHKIESMRLISTHKAELKEKMNLEIKELMRHDKNYEEMMYIKDGKSNILFHIKKKENMINELVMTINAEKEFTVIFITGNFTFEDIKKIAEMTQ
jgi:vacuolar-type H+-ATPase subunit F/Vma7